MKRISFDEEFGEFLLKDLDYLEKRLLILKIIEKELEIKHFTRYKVLG